MPNLNSVAWTIPEIQILSGLIFVSSNSLSLSFSSTRRDFINEPILTSEVPLDLSQPGIVPSFPGIFCDFLHFLPIREKVFQSVPRGFIYNPMGLECMPCNARSLPNKHLFHNFFRNFLHFLSKGESIVEKTILSWEFIHLPIFFKYISFDAESWYAKILILH